VRSRQSGAVPEPLSEVVVELRALLLDSGLRRAVAAGRRRGAEPPAWRRAELRPVRLKSGLRLQEVCYDECAAHTRNLAYPGEAASAVDDLLEAPWGNWHVDSAGGTVQVRVTKSGMAQVHRAAAPAAAAQSGAGPATSAPSDVGTAASGAPDAASHDRPKRWLLAPDDPLFGVLGADAAKRRQVDAFLRVLVGELDAVADRDPLHVVDLGCGNAYLSFAAHRFLTVRGHDVRLTGVDLRAAAATRNAELAQRLGATGAVFVAGSITEAKVAPGDVVLALHACDTATDDALARAVGWGARLILAAPCCHHETAASLRAAVPDPYAVLLRHGVLRERFADVLTDGLRALLLRLVGYRVDVVEFVSTEHSARNVAIRAVRTDAPAAPEQVAAYRELVAEWGLRLRLAAHLATELTDRHGGQW
jgi:SAM-dependent methyltransferase